MTEKNLHLNCFDQKVILTKKYREIRIFIARTEKEPKSSIYFDFDFDFED